MKKYTYILCLILGVLKASFTLAQSYPVKDPKFLAYLKEKHPFTLNTDNEIVIALANAEPGAIICYNRGIKDLDGLQHYSNMEEIFAQNNLLESIPDISHFKKLKTINLSQNKINSLPSFRNFQHLKKLYLYQNQLTIFPDIVGCDSLTHIYAYNNQIGSIPELDKFTQLQLIEFGDNKLSTLPSLDKLTSLEFLYAWENQLTSIPSLANLPKLKNINVALNKLTESPDFSKNYLLDSIVIDKNEITKAPKVNHIPHLSLFSIFNNRLTFSELEKLKSVNSDTSYLFPQKSIPAGNVVNIKEFENSTFTYEKETSSFVQYQWMKNGNTLTNKKTNTLTINTVLKADSGYYYILLTDPLFPGIELHTDSFQLRVLPCLDYNSFSFATKPITCTSKGEIQITNNSSENINKYFLTGVNTGAKLEAQNGLFENLSETKFLLTIQKNELCSIDNPSIIYLPKNDCKEVIITPNGDGDQDSYYFQQDGIAKIYSKDGVLQTTLQIPTEWKGLSNSGNVAPGYYYAEINNGSEFVLISVIY